MTAIWKTLAAQNGTPVPLLTHYRDDAKANVLVLPALGTDAGYYRPLVDALYGAGFGCAALELRGQQHSPLRASRHCDWGFAELLTQDIPAAVSALRDRAPSAPLYLCGHSLGGHLALASTALEPLRFDGLIVAACSSPWHGVFDGKLRRQLRVLTALLPAVTRLLGYFPGVRIGFGGREARTVMLDWRTLAVDDRYTATGMKVDFDAGIASYRGPALFLHFDEDMLAPRAATEHLARRLGAATLTFETIGADALGRRADHFGWCRQPDEVVRRIACWHDALAAGATSAIPAASE